MTKRVEICEHDHYGTMIAKIRIDGKLLGRGESDDSFYGPHEWVFDAVEELCKEFGVECVGRNS